MRTDAARPATSSVALEIDHDAHRVQFYEDDGFLTEAVARFVGAALGAGEGALVIATPVHRTAVEERLVARGLDVRTARAEGRYLTADAGEMLSTIMVGELPDAGRFGRVVGGAVAAVAGHGRRRVCAFGEMVTLLWAEGKREAAIRLEGLWNDLAALQRFSLLCAYPIAAFGREADGELFLRICGQHSDVVPAESFASLASAGERMRAVTHLQQKARALETEIAQRQAAEEALRERTQIVRALVEASPLPIVVIDPDTTVRLWNPAAVRVFGWSEAEVLGRPMPIVPAEKLGECACVREAVVRGETVLGAETYRTRRDGVSVDLLVSAAPLPGADGSARAIVLLFEDVTAEAARQKTLRELMTVYELGRVLSAELELARLLQALTDAATQLSGARVGAFFPSATGEPGEHCRLHAFSGAAREAFEALGVPHDTALCRPTFQGKNVVRLADARVAGGSPQDDMVAEGPLRSYLAVPVVGRTGDVFGGLFLGHPDPGVFTDDAERVVVGLGAQAAVAIENARLYEAACRARKDAEAANRRKDEFLAMLGHELRNPLAAVRNAITAARLDPGRGDRALEIAHRGTDQLARLVDDLLDVARITQGRIPLHVQRLPLAGVVERAVESTRRLVEDRAHAIAVSLPAADVQVDGDATRLEQVVANLVSNAAKYSDPGGRIVVTATVEAGEAVLRVRDDGIGIAPETLPHVFDLFAQGDRALDRAQGGLGIGLTIVKRLVELHGGRVEAHSRGLAQGAEFVVRLPAVLAPRGEAVAPPAATGGLQSGCARVLVVEDNVDAAESLRMLLELLGHRVRVVHDGPHALEVARATPPDVMLVDIGLPGMDGYEVARRAGEDADLRDVVLVALTGYGRGEDRKRALAAGFHHHLVKPVNPDALLGLLANVGPHARSARTGAVPAVEAGSASAAPSRA